MKKRVNSNPAFKNITIIWDAYQDFIKDKEELRAFLKNWLSEHANDIGAFDNASETIDSYIDGKYPLQFFITNGLTVMFQPYDIAPYAAGLIEIPVDDDLLKENLNDF